ncbi:penicillin-binding transpeptidase domain-containing protein [Woodsholea maritima]|uniref:penicillin-binding transpeptidase domain-containing protein n=1 Tax=Woodsholea maritima TaxID=240237 RepID=UPI0003773EDC|nr:penicillin-binding transpeptidase domain-containing protein [Woodsholea maritima]
MTKWIVKALSVVAALLGAPLAQAQIAPGANVLDPVLEEIALDGTIYIQRVSDGAVWSANEARSAMRFVPASTYKIPNTLISLETGVTTWDEVFIWDGQPRMFARWERDMTLAEAFQLSAVPVYQELAHRVSYRVMQDWVQRLAYGNQDIGAEDNIDQFWLSGPVAISAQEQVGLVTRLEAQTLPFNTDNQRRLGEVMIVDSELAGVLHGKTGWTRQPGRDFIGWFVGWYEFEGEDYVFAMNAEVSDFDSQAGYRKGLIETALKRVTGED